MGYVKSLGGTQSRAELLSRTGEYPSLLKLQASMEQIVSAQEKRSAKWEKVMPLSQVMLSVSLVCSASMSIKSNWSTLVQGSRQMCMACGGEESLDRVPREKKPSLITSESKRTVQ